MLEGRGNDGPGERDGRDEQDFLKAGGLRERMK
jgi:hypothetical protein